MASTPPSASYKEVLSRQLPPEPNMDPLASGASPAAASGASPASASASPSASSASSSAALRSGGHHGRRKNKSNKRSISFSSTEPGKSVPSPTNSVPSPTKAQEIKPQAPAASALPVYNFLQENKSSKTSMSSSPAQAQKIKESIQALLLADEKYKYVSQADYVLGDVIQVLEKMQTYAESIEEENRQLRAYVNSLSDILSIPEHFGNVVPDLYSNVYAVRLATWETKNEISKIWKYVKAKFPGSTSSNDDT